MHSNEDDLTVKLTEIILTNNMVKASLAKGTDMMTLMVSSLMFFLVRYLMALYRNDGTFSN